MDIKKFIKSAVICLMLLSLFHTGIKITKAAETAEDTIQPSINIDLSILDELDKLDIDDRTYGSTSSEIVPKVYHDHGIEMEDHKEMINGFIYFNQGDDEWNDNGYHMKQAGCGPTSMAVVISSLTDQWVTPVDAAVWAYDHGYYSSAGSSHALIPALSKEYKLDCEGVGTDASKIRNALEDGNPVVCLMGPGYFTKGGHFMVLVGIDEDDNVTVADVGSRERSKYKYQLEDIISQSKSASAGGPFWIISNPGQGESVSDSDYDDAEETESEDEQKDGELHFTVIKKADQKRIEKVLVSGTPVMMMTDGTVIKGEEFVYITMIDSSKKVTVTDRNFKHRKKYLLSELMSHKKFDITGLSFWKISGDYRILIPFTPSK